MNKNSKVPKLRFPEFTGDWEQRKLGDVLRFQNGFNGGKEVYGEGTAFISVMDVLNNQFITYDCIREKAALSDEEQERFDVRYGDVLFQRSSENVEDAGKSNVYIDHDKSAIFGGFVIRGRQISPYSPKFMKYLLDTNLVRRQIIKKAQGAQHVNVSQETLQSIQIFLPSIDEQVKIERFFFNIDNLITLHQRKVDNLKNIKKSMLQKLFPKKGEKYPEVRFKGFTDAWEQRKLGDVLEIVNRKNGDSYGKEDVLSVSDEYGCINQIRFQGRSFAGEDISNYKVVETGDIIYTRSPLKSKPYGIIKVVSDEVGIVSPLYIVNKPKDGNDSEFIYRVFDSPEKTNSYLSPLVRKGAKNTMNISNDEWLSGEITVSSSFEEQREIGLLFKRLDNLITLHQRKLDNLNNIKKGFLQQMFA